MLPNELVNQMLGISLSANERARLTRRHRDDRRGFFRELSRLIRELATGLSNIPGVQLMADDTTMLDRRLQAQSRTTVTLTLMGSAEKYESVKETALRFLSAIARHLGHPIEERSVDDDGDLYLPKEYDIVQYLPMGKKRDALNGRKLTITIKLRWRTITFTSSYSGRVETIMDR